MNIMDTTAFPITTPGRFLCPVVFWATCLTACSGQSPESSSTTSSQVTLTTAYRKQASAVLEAIDSGKPADTVKRDAIELTKLGVQMLDSLQSSHPECTSYFDAIRKVATTLHQLPLSEIESGYHMDGKLPDMPAAECYHGKDLVVHPATVAAIARLGLSTPDERTQAHGEITEVLSHLEGATPPK